MAGQAQLRCAVLAPPPTRPPTPRTPALHPPPNAPSTHPPVPPVLCTGQGIVYEALDMSQLPEYTVGGTIQIVVNNQVGAWVGGW